MRWFARHETSVGLILAAVGMLAGACRSTRNSSMQVLAGVAIVVLCLAIWASNEADALDID